jgi:hypothetical protein
MACAQSSARDEVPARQHTPHALIPPLKKGGRGDLPLPSTHLPQVLDFRRGGKSDGDAMAREFTLVLALHPMSARP